MNARRGSPWRSRFFLVACAFEAGLLAVAVPVALLLGRPPLADLHGSAAGAAVGVVAAAPPFLGFLWMLRSPARPLTRIRDLLDDQLRPLFAPLTLPQIALVSALAGAGEEVLFRGVIQGAVADLAGPAAGLVVASALFGAAHLITPAYGVVAAFMGLYLGALWMASGNLLVPILTHGIYDFAVLVYWLRAGSGGRARD